MAPLVEGARFCPACGKATAATESGTAWPAMGGAPDLAGKEIAGRYRILNKLGEGGMGAVYRGEQISLKRTVAVKLLRPELGSHQTILQRFNAEAHAVAKLSHPNTVNIYDFGQDTDGSLFIAMEFIEGRSLRDAIQKEGPFPPWRALAIALQVAASLSDAHAHSIVHRDLKPDNVMLQDRGKHKDVVRVLDFGIAKLRDDNRATQAAMTQAGDMLGTPQYMAPEQIRGEAIDGRTDIYALGCMLYEMVTARLPYEAPTIMAMLSKHLLETPVPPTQRRPELALPPAIDQLVLSAMAKNPAERPATMDQFSELMAALQATLPGDPNRSGALSPGGLGSGPYVTPPAHSAVHAHAFAPSTPAPDAGYAPTAHPGFAPPGPPPGPGYASPAPPGFAGHAPPPDAAHPHVAPTAIVERAQRAGSRAPLYAILGLLALGGAGAGIYFATRGDDKPSTAAAPAQPTDQPPVQHGQDPDKPVDQWASPDTPAPNKPTDSWGDPASAVKSVGTAETPIPAGATIIPPPGFVQMASDSKSIAYVHADSGVMIGMAPLYPGTNDPKALARLHTKATKASLVTDTTVFSHGAEHPILVFKAKAGGLPVAQALILYITPAYRLAVLIQASEAAFSDEDFIDGLDEILENNIRLPATLP